MTEDVTRDSGIVGRPIVETRDLAEWLIKVASGDWSWVYNTRCKYVNLRMDTRRGAYLIEDRDGNALSARDLFLQDRADTVSTSGRFADWSTVTMAAQCRMQARDSIDPEYSQFMDAVSDRLSGFALTGKAPI